MKVRFVGKITEGLVIDALLGFSIKGSPRGKHAELIDAINKSGSQILSVDIPSGLNPDNGIPYNPCVRAEWTVTMALPKTGILKPSAKKAVGELFVGNIGVPDEVYKRFGVRTPFRSKEILLKA